MQFFSLTSNKNDGYFTWRREYIYDNISPISSYNEKCFRRRFVEKIRVHILCSVTSTHTHPRKAWRVYSRMWTNNGRAKQARDGSVIRRMLCACWIPKGNRHTLRICNAYYFFSTATVVTRTRLCVTFIRTLPVLYVFYSAWIRIDDVIRIAMWLCLVAVW